MPRGEAKLPREEWVPVVPDDAPKPEVEGKVTPISRNEMIGEKDSFRDTIVAWKPGQVRKIK
jgi:hypothetical protein